MVSWLSTYSGVRPPQSEPQFHCAELCEPGQSELPSLGLSVLICKMHLKGLNELMHIKCREQCLIQRKCPHLSAATSTIIIINIEISGETISMPVTAKAQSTVPRIQLALVSLLALPCKNLDKHRQVTWPLWDWFLYTNMVHTSYLALFTYNHVWEVLSGQRLAHKEHPTNQGYDYWSWKQRTKSWSSPLQMLARGESSETGEWVGEKGTPRVAEGGSSLEKVLQGRSEDEAWEQGINQMASCHLQGFSHWANRAKVKLRERSWSPWIESRKEWSKEDEPVPKR